MQRRIEAPKCGGPAVSGGAPSSATSFLDLASHPATVGMTLLACALGASGAGVVALPMLVSIAGATLLSASRPEVKARLAAQRRRRVIRERRDDREARLEEANVRRDRLAGLTDLVDEIGVWEPAIAERLEFESLLDRYADLEAALARCHRVRDAREPVWLRTGDGVELVYCHPPGAAHAMRAAIEEDQLAIEDLLIRIAEHTAGRACGALMRDLDLDREIDPDAR